MSKRFKCIARTVDISASTTLVHEDKYGAWMAVNIGTAAATVLGFPLQPGEGLDFTNAVPAGSTFATDIPIVINAGAVVRIMRMQYQEMK